MSDHLPNKPDFAASDFYLFMNMNKLLGSQNFDVEKELHNAVTDWL